MRVVPVVSVERAPHTPASQCATCVLMVRSAQVLVRRRGAGLLVRAVRAAGRGGPGRGPVHVRPPGCGRGGRWWCGAARRARAGAPSTVYQAERERACVRSSHAAGGTVPSPKSQSTRSLSPTAPPLFFAGAAVPRPKGRLAGAAESSHGLNVRCCGVCRAPPVRPGCQVRSLRRLGRLCLELGFLLPRQGGLVRSLRCDESSLGRPRGCAGTSA